MFFVFFMIYSSKKKKIIVAKVIFTLRESQWCNYECYNMKRNAKIVLQQIYGGLYLSPSPKAKANKICGMEGF